VAAEDLHCEQFDVIAAFPSRRAWMSHCTSASRSPSGPQWYSLPPQQSHLRPQEAPRAWHMTLRKKLLERGFVVCEADPSLFILGTRVGVWLRSMLTTA
jgi:hypothetical protein